jgi:4-hydroxybenzoate polyprenyltransferase
VAARIDPPAYVLWFALTVWIAGFDLIYACQDVDFDRAHGLYSFPARFGIAAALRTAQVCHALTAVAFAVVGVMLSLGPLFWLGWLAVIGLLVYEHSLVTPTDLSRLDVAFFNVNGYIAVIVLAGVVGGLWR